MSKYLEDATPREMTMYVHLASIVNSLDNIIESLFDED